MVRLSVLSLLLLAVAAPAQVPDIDWEFDDPYDDQMLYLHESVNYAYDLQWQFDWEQRQLAGSAIRINTGSVSSNTLLTDIDVNINEPLSNRWRFLAQFRRNGLRQQSQRSDQLMLGLERSILASSAIYLTVNPEFDKEFIDVAAGYTFYKRDREQYVRVGMLLEDFSYDTKNEFGGNTEQNPIALQWIVRLGLGNDWFIYSEGDVGTGFERLFADIAKSPDLSRHDHRENSAEIRVSRMADDGLGWSGWVSWYDFNEIKQFRQAGFDYDYRNTQVHLAAEHTRVVQDRHRLRFLVYIVDQEARSRGLNEHEYDRTDLLGGFFYEYLWSDSGAGLGYAFGQPDIVFESPDPTASYMLDDYRDKIMVGWRHAFSTSAQLRLSVSHEVSSRGFGGGSLQFQMSF